eukprot:g1629.t1
MKTVVVIFVVATVLLNLQIEVVAQQKGTQKENVNLPLTFETCTAPGSCSSSQGKVTLDSNWRWTHKVGTYTNCYTGNEWDPTFCPDPSTCTQNCAIDGVPQDDWTNTYGITSDGTTLDLKFVTQGQYSKNVGSRTYLLAESGDKYEMFKLKNKEFTFDVDVSNMPCGLNGALYFVEMQEDGGMSEYATNKAGAAYGTGYCDAQCPHDIKFIDGEANSDGWKPSGSDKNAGTGKYGSCCTELDIWESNSQASAVTPHVCDTKGPTRCSGIDCGDDATGNRFDGLCDKDGCDWNPFRMGDQTFFGEGANFKVDTSKTFTVVTQFHTSDGTDSGDLVEIRRLFVQDGVVVQQPNASIAGLETYDSITDEFCSTQKTAFGDPNIFGKKGGLKVLGDTLDRGMVLVMSMWDDHAADMLWLDSDYPLNKSASQPGVSRGPCPTSSGKPDDVESQHPDSNVKYGNIKVGAIGSTFGPSPSPSPTPTPTPGGDCPESPDPYVNGSRKVLGKRKRRLEMKIFSKKKVFIGRFETGRDDTRFNDIATLVQKYKRDIKCKGRTIRLSKDRIDAVAKMLRDEPESNVRSLEDLQRLVRECRGPQLASPSSISEYYDASRAEAYTSHNAHAQNILSTRCLELSGGGPPQKMCELAIDLGCGSGLSTIVTSEAGYAVVGADLSHAMLTKASRDAAERGDVACIDFVCCDLSQPLPFRSDTFDAATSTSAIHFMCEKVGARDPDVRCDTFFSELARCTKTKQKGAIVCQFHACKEGRAFNRTLSQSSSRVGWIPRLVIDRPHRTKASRWFLALRRREEEEEKVSNEGAGEAPTSSQWTCPTCWPERAICPLQYIEIEGNADSRKSDRRVPRLDEAHRAWLEREHVRFARRLIRSTKWLTKQNESTKEARCASAKRTDRRTKKRGAVLSKRELALAEALQRAFEKDAATQEALSRKQVDVIRNPKVRRLRLNNRAVRSRIVERRGAQEFLVSIGFVKASGSSAEDPAIEVAGEDLARLLHGRSALSSVAKDLGFSISAAPKPPKMVTVEEDRERLVRDAFKSRIDRVMPQPRGEMKSERELRLLKERETRLRAKKMREAKVGPGRRATRVLCVGGKRVAIKSEDTIETVSSSSLTSSSDGRLIRSVLKRRHADAEKLNKFSTRSMRELEVQRRKRVCVEILFKVTLPCKSVVQARFRMDESVQNLVEEVTSWLLPDVRGFSFRLVTSAPRVVVTSDSKRSLGSLRLGQASNLYMLWEKNVQPPPASRPHWLSDETLRARGDEDGGADGNSSGKRAGTDAEYFPTSAPVAGAVVGDDKEGPSFSSRTRGGRRGGTKGRAKPSWLKL